MGKKNLEKLEAEAEQMQRARRMIEVCWLNYYRIMLRGDAGPDPAQRRRDFFAGAMGMFDIFNTNRILQPTPAGQMARALIASEIDTFLASDCGQTEIGPRA